LNAHRSKRCSTSPSSAARGGGAPRSAQETREA
jgi:hypothetical protein